MEAIVQYSAGKNIDLYQESGESGLPMDALSVLRHIPLFAGMPEDQIRILSESAREKNIRPGQMIFADAQESRALHIVVWGRVKIFKSTPEGREQTIFVFGPGEPFCLTALTDQCSPAGATALEDTRILFFPAEVLEDLARKEPSLLFNMLLVLSRRLKESMELIESLSLKEIPQRLASFLAHSLAQEGRYDRVDLRFSQRELAKIIGATPETLSRVLKRMSEEGILSLKGRRTIRVLSREGLQRLARGERRPEDGS
jgi:CRP/FNR family transcriptional regulator